MIYLHREAYQRAWLVGASLPGEAWRAREGVGGFSEWLWQLFIGGDSYSYLECSVSFQCQG